MYSNHESGLVMTPPPLACTHPRDVDTRARAVDADADRSRNMRAAFHDRGAAASPFRRDARVRRATRGTARRGGAAAASAATTARLTRERCVEYVRSGCKPRDRFRCARIDASTRRRGDGRRARRAGMTAGDDVARVVKNLKK
jgi:hypothetical protein